MKQVVPAEAALLQEANLNYEQNVTRKQEETPVPCRGSDDGTQIERTKPGTEADRMKRQPGPPLPNLVGSRKRRRDWSCVNHDNSAGILQVVLPEVALLHEANVEVSFQARVGGCDAAGWCY